MEILLVSNDNLNKFKEFAKESALHNKAVYGKFIEFSKTGRKLYEAGLAFDFAMGNVYASDGNLIYPKNNSNVGISAYMNETVQNITIYVEDVAIVNVTVQESDPFSVVIEETLACISETGHSVYDQNKTRNDNYSLLEQEIMDYCNKQKGSSQVMSALSDMTKAAEKMLNENGGGIHGDGADLISGFREAIDKVNIEASEEIGVVKIPDTKIMEIATEYCDGELVSIIGDEKKFKNKVTEIARWVETMIENCTSTFELGLTFNTNDVVTSYRFEVMSDGTIVQKGSVPYEAFMNEFRRMVIADDTVSLYGVGICSIFQKEREPLVIMEFSDKDQSIDVVRNNCVQLFETTLHIISDLFVNA